MSATATKAPKNSIPSLLLCILPIIPFPPSAFGVYPSFLGAYIAGVKALDADEYKRAMLRFHLKRAWRTSFQKVAHATFVF
jgi:hypothetical protein